MKKLPLMAFAACFGKERRLHKSFSAKFPVGAQSRSQVAASQMYFLSLKRNYLRIDLGGGGAHYLQIR